MVTEDNHCLPSHPIASSRVMGLGEQARLSLAVTQEWHQLKSCTYTNCECSTLWFQTLFIGICMHFTQDCHLISEAKVIGKWQEMKLYLYPHAVSRGRTRLLLFAIYVQSYEGTYMKTWPCALTFAHTLHHQTRHVVNMWHTTLLPLCQTSDLC